MPRALTLIKKATRRIAEQLHSWHIVRGDKVKIMTGKDKGKVGEIVRVERKTNRVVVSGANLAKKHMHGPDKDTKGSIQTIEMPLHVSNVALLDPSDKNPTRIRMGFILDEKTGEQTKVRVSKRTGVVIPRPPILELEAQQRRAKRVDGLFDTTKDEAIKKTYNLSCVSLFFQRKAYMPTPNHVNSIAKK